MSTKRDYYEILSVKKNASLDEVKKAYREAALRHHPDRVEHDKKKDSWSFVHAAMHHFPATYKDGVVTGITRFIV